MHQILPFCRRCLFEGVNEAELTQKIAAYLQALPAAEKTGADAYADRLARCDSCPHLENGLCRLCGCFVLYRAGHQGKHCPDTPAHW